MIREEAAWTLPARYAEAGRCIACHVPAESELYRHAPTCPVRRAELQRRQSLSMAYRGWK